MPVWEHVDEYGDRIRLMELNVPNRYRFWMAGREIHGAVVDLSVEDLYRLRDEIEKIATS